MKNYLIYFTLAVFLLAWLTHLVVCIIYDQIALLVVGLIIFPIGILHGFICWLGWLF